ncbi:dihydropteroate synthase [Phaeocystidibacter luteus]|uniref:Dihydropteroate synthase n=1 Tax=Phaeocystidibacter luteus TaxID=911197 RepID=A0A6N6RG33_9FLAO|nr:dihydropteroate synthase [Phaeocystidibacter luteus]KAB2810029.1 dihydropteroate synthase [Phaeocystidibacter luteus]
MKKTIRVGSGLIDLSSPKIMGIINLTPDSFYDGGTSSNVDDALRKAEQMLEEGADWLDIGAQSTRPKAEQIGAEAEWNRLEGPLSAIAKRFPEAILSIDTYHSAVAEKAISAGGHIINDISGGTLDAQMFETAGRLKVPYILMHIQGTPETMQENPEYDNVVVDVTRDLATKCDELIAHGVDDILIDPGFGFGKTNAHNYALLQNLEHLKAIGHPILIGLSRKSMIWKTLGCSAGEALNGTTALNMTALMHGASVLRVHDVKPAVEVRTLWQQLQNSDRRS